MINYLDSQEYQNNVVHAFGQRNKTYQDIRANTITDNLFNRIEIDTERLIKTKTYFDRGEFREADAILDAEAMAADLGCLVEREQQLDREKAMIAQSRTQISNEYVIKARLWATFCEKAEWFEQTCTYFRSALDATRTAELVFEFALFLQKHNCFDEAQLLYDEALQIRRGLAEANPHAFLPDVAMTLNNLANLQKAQKAYSSARQNYDEALQYYRGLADANPRIFFPYVATTLNNLAVLQSEQNEYGLARQNYDEALQIRRELAEANPHTFFPYVATTLINLSIFYLQNVPNQEKSIALANEVLNIAQQFPQVPTVQGYADTARQVLQAHCAGSNRQATKNRSIWNIFGW